MIIVTKFIENECSFDFWVTSLVYYKVDNDPSIEFKYNFNPEYYKDFIELSGIFGYNLYTKELKDLDGNLINLEKLVSKEE